MVRKSAKKKLQGYVEDFDGIRLNGWVADLNSDVPVAFTIYSRDFEIGSCIAEVFREDLQSAGIHGGKHGFSVDLNFSNVDAIQEVTFIENESKQIFKLINQDKVLEFFNGKILEAAKLNEIKESKLIDEDFYESHFGSNLKDAGLDRTLHCINEGFEKDIKFSEYGNNQYLKNALNKEFNIQKPSFMDFFDNYRNVDFSVSPFFDKQFYEFQLKAKRLECDQEFFSHYLKVGYKAGLLPSAFFDPILLKRAGFPFGKKEVIRWVIDLYRNTNPDDCLKVSRWYDEASYEQRYEVRQYGWMSGIEHYFNDGILNKYTSGHPMFFKEIYSNTIAHHSSLPAEVYISRYLQMPKPTNMVTKDYADISVIILNWNKSLLTIQCVTTLMASLTDTRLKYEVVIVDNGSNPSDYFNLIESLGNKCKIIRNAENKFYGEANNIGVEASVGKNVLFLNNDAFVTESTVKEMMALIDEDNVGGIGAKLLFPNGVLQEAGGKISACGQVTQVGKGLEHHEAMYTDIREVDYCSAACLLMNKQFFLDIGGFDYLYEPAYFEDTDLCTKIKLFGKKMLLQPKAITYHVENLTSRDPALNFQFFENIKTNRNKYVGRWHKFSEGLQTKEKTIEKLGLESFIRSSTESTGFAKKALVFSPYHLNPGGGERYILTIAAALEKMGYQTFFATPDNLSQTRLRNLGRDLHLDLNRINPISWSKALSDTNFEIQVTMGNEVIPPVQGIAAHNIYHCQFPFDINEDLVANNLEFLSTYKSVIVNSNFTKENYLRLLSNIEIETIDVQVVHPPCPQIGVTEEQATTKRPWVLNVGRFFTGGHQKKQHIAIEAFKELIDSNPSLISKGVELHLAGSIGTIQSHSEYFDSLVKQAEGYPVKFHSNISNHDLQELYKNALVYWHFTGWGEDIEHSPEVFEHFGISPVEAMSAGVVPVLPDFAGPAETLKSIGENSFSEKMSDILKETLSIIQSNNTDSQIKHSLKLSNKANQFSEKHFIEVIQSLVSKITGIK